MSEYLRIRNWMKYQKIAGDKAPFVQVQTDILLDMDFMSLPDRERLCFLLLLCLAGRTQNKLPADPVQLMHVCHFDDVPNVSLMVSRGLLEPWTAEKHQQIIEFDEERRRYERHRKREYRASRRCPEDVPAMSQGETETETETEKDLSGPTVPDAHENEFARAREHAPLHPNDNRKKALKAWKARVREGVDATLLADRWIAYRDTCDGDRRFIKHQSTFYGPDGHWEMEYAKPERVPDDLAGLRALIAERQLDIDGDLDLPRARKAVAAATGMRL